jgi:hypothetical protein
MNQNKNIRPKGRFNSAPRESRTVKCSCGGVAKLKTRKNFSFGQASKGRTMKFYKCIACGKRLNN